ncbi:hypothetical protein HMPREF1981_02222 [Bacteroides pyogenes F0041]|uniref:Uncharacterized protein n=1 Tax=Bacteroides pyogenes F0041 TaxID=1321819 RepID=U2DY20_9BACE|nr:hypothetical protein HMPREF1981_02222 [Bacteroides pyogenes F0041]GAE22388.1 hypothetical protein JCM10003_1978 [Bacteroides pyogenes JCM 10003]
MTTATKFSKKEGDAQSIRISETERRQGIVYTLYDSSRYYIAHYYLTWIIACKNKDISAKNLINRYFYVDLCFQAKEI